MKFSSLFKPYKYYRYFKRRPIVQRFKRGINFDIIFRKDKIVELCSGKTVLHLGFIQHSHLYKDLIKDKKWLHEKLFQCSKRLVGIDYLEKDVEYIKKTYGYECYYGDVTQLDKVPMREQFEVVVCGELIEHVENAGLMLNGIKHLMNANSILIITSPNPWSSGRLKLIRNGYLENEWLNTEHVCWYSYETLKQLLERFGFCEESFSFYYGEEEKDYFSSHSLLERIKNKKNRLAIFNTDFYNFDGLFFVARLKQ